MFVGNGSTMPRLQYRAGVASSYTYANYRSITGASANTLLSDRLGFQVFGALGITDWLEVNAVVPVIAYQKSNTSFGAANAGLGNPWLHAKVSVLDASKPLSLAVDFGLGIPVGTAAAQGNGGFEFAPKVQLGRVFNAWQFGAEVGALVRSQTDFRPLTGSFDDKVGTQLWLGVMVATVSSKGPRGEFTFRGFAPLVPGGRPGFEGQLAFRWPFGGVEIYASAGPGFAGEPSTPLVRAYLGIAFASTPMSLPQCEEGLSYELSFCPELDRDGDGVPNGVDREPLIAEDRDGVEDADGAPDLDDDKDGTPDETDECRDVAGPAGNQGCPDYDEDADGIVDRLDACAKVPEDKDDFEDTDGCPEPDNDADGIRDADDACPREAGIAQEKGCPAKDSDKDGVMDHADNCPNDVGPEANFGCAANKKQLVKLEGNTVVFLEPVVFEAGKASLQKKSAVVLDGVIAVLIAHPEIRAITISARAEETSAESVSVARAEAVKAYLIKRGVDENRLSAKGSTELAPGTIGLRW